MLLSEIQASATAEPTGVARFLVLYLSNAIVQTRSFPGLADAERDLFQTVTVVVEEVEEAGRNVLVPKAEPGSRSPFWGIGQQSWVSYARMVRQETATCWCRVKATKLFDNFSAVDITAPSGNG